MMPPRIVMVFEHECIPIVAEGFTPARAENANQTDAWLTETEARYLLGLNALRPGFCQRSGDGVKFAQYCGIVGLGTCVLEILPKIGMQEDRDPDEAEHARVVLLSMLYVAKRLAIAEPGTAAQQIAQAPLLDLFIEAFLDSALAQARQGLLSRYIRQADDLTVLKGRFAAHEHVRRNHSRPQLLYCEYDEFSADNAYNRAVRATLRACRDGISRPSTHRKWFEVQARFASVTEQSMSAAEVRRLPRDRTTHRYEQLLRWCEWLLGVKSPLLKSGATEAPALLFDMNKLFEDYVAHQYVCEADPSHTVIRHGPQRGLALRAGEPLFTLEPDITVWATSATGANTDLICIADAKWKRLSPTARDWGVAQSDVYQLLAYAFRYGCRRLELVYPEPTRLTETAPIFHIPAPDTTAAPITITVRTLPLWQDYQC